MGDGEQCRGGPGLSIPLRMKLDPNGQITSFLFFSFNSFEDETVKSILRKTRSGNHLSIPLRMKLGGPDEGTVLIYDFQFL